MTVPPPSFRRISKLENFKLAEFREGPSVAEFPRDSDGGVKKKNTQFQSFFVRTKFEVLNFRSERDIEDGLVVCFCLQRGVRGRGPTTVTGARMSVLRGERRGESRGSGISLPSAPAGGEVGAAAASVADPQEAGRTLGVEGPRHDLRQEHHEGSQEEAVVEHMTPPRRPPPRRTRRAGQKGRHRRPQQQRLLESLTMSSAGTSRRLFQSATNLPSILCLSEETDRAIV